LLVYIITITLCVSAGCLVMLCRSADWAVRWLETRLDAGSQGVYSDGTWIVLCNERREK
jgi:hypothetical protein